MTPQNDKGGSKRLHIIGSNEIAAIYDLPRFSAEDQAHFFSLSAHERAVLPELRTYTSRIFFILQLGYFKAVRQFFVFNLDEVVQDVTWIQQTHFPGSKLPEKPVAKGTRLKHQSLILYLLSYIDSLPLRQNVQQAMNRGESYHQLRRAVSYANFGALRFKTESDQLIWSESSRLITNCIIYYNAALLSQLLEIKEAAGEEEQVNLLGRVSPIAWQHINFHGRFEFLDPPAPIDLESVVQDLVRGEFSISEVLNCTFLRGCAKNPLS